MVVRISPFLPVLLGLAVAGLGGCQPAKPTTTADEAAPASGAISAPIVTTGAVTTASDGPTSSPVAANELISCADEIGATAAEKRAKVCLSVSPATHPPCNTANSCAMIEDEIARSCALFDGQGPAMPGCETAPKSSEAAVAVITRYYAALNAHDYGTAWQQWGDNGPPNQTMAKFSAGFAHTRSTHVAIGKLEPAEGGAGSIYQDVPVVVDATLDNGSHQRFTGNYTVRRVNGVDGASAEQLRWHIGMAHLTAAPAG